MTFERATIEERLKRLHGIIHNLSDVRSIAKNEFVADFHHFWLAERGLQLAAEIVLDIANHILASVFNRYPETNEEALDALRQSGVISENVSNQLRGFGGLRNILVHAYLDIDEAQVYEHLQKTPEIVKSFSEEILAWIDSR